jgi:hypothetical protein
MRRSSLPTKATSGRRSRWRALLAGVVVAGIAMGGLAAAAPAAAEDTPVVPASTLEIAVTACGSYGGQGVLNYIVRDPNAFYRDFIWIRDATNAIVHEAAYLDGTEFEADVDLDPGTYTIQYSVEHETGAATIDVQTFTIGECPDLGVSVTPLACSTDRTGEALLTLTGLASGIITYDVQGPSFAVGGSLDEFGETEEIDLVGMPPGNYYAYVEWHPFAGEGPPPAPVFDWVGFAIEPCQPVGEVEVTQCTVAGGTGSATVTLSTLVAGVEYAVWVTDAGAAEGESYGEPQFVTGDSTGTASLTFGSLPGGRDYTVWVDGVWQAIPPWEEPPFIGNGGNFDPLESVVLATSADFSLQPCPAAPVKPASTMTLPPTGPDGVGGALLAAVALLGLGGVALLLARRRLAGAPDLS